MTRIRIFLKSKKRKIVIKPLKNKRKERKTEIRNL